MCLLREMTRIRRRQAAVMLRCLHLEDGDALAQPDGWLDRAQVPCRHMGKAGVQGQTGSKSNQETSLRTVEPCRYREKRRNRAGNEASRMRRGGRELGDGDGAVLRGAIPGGVI